MDTQTAHTHYLNACRRNRLKPSTIESYAIVLGMFARDTAYTDTDQLTEELIYKFQDAHPATNANTMRGYLTVLRQYSAHLFKHKIINADPFTLIKMPRVPTPIRAQISIEQAKRLLEYMPTDKHTYPVCLRNQALWAIMILGGLRVGEAVALRVMDIRDNEIVITNGKGGKGRTVPLLPRCAAILSDYRRALGYWHGRDIPPHAWLFPNKNDSGTHLSPTKATEWFSRYAKELGLEGITSHACRHLYATTLHRNGARLNDIKDLLGHANLQSTQIYMHSTANDIAAAAALHPLANL